jgi:hypothetical protein
LNASGFTQIIFEKGYFINNSNEKIKCLIKNNDWKNNPVEFKYQLTDSSEIKTANIKMVKEFSIDNTSKYYRRTISIDRSGTTVHTLSTDRNPVFKEEQLFLKVLMEGKASLYYYEEKNLKRFFYTNENSTLKQLVYKKYLTSDNKIKENNQFKQELWLNLKCNESISLKEIEKLQYTYKSLVHLFSIYNYCHHSEPKIYKKKHERELFNFTIRPRLNFSSLDIEKTSGLSSELNFDNQTTFGFGTELELILPYNNNTWSICFEPTYQYFKDDMELNTTFKTSAEIKYSSIELPFSLRHYFFLNKDSKIFINASYVFDLTLYSSINYLSSTGAIYDGLNIETRNNFGFGLGFKQSDKYSLEIRFQTGREILSGYPYLVSKYKTFSAILGYTIF